MPSEFQVSNDQPCRNRIAPQRPLPALRYAQRSRCSPSDQPPLSSPSPWVLFITKHAIWGFSPFCFYCRNTRRVKKMKRYRRRRKTQKKTGNPREKRRVNCPSLQSHHQARSWLPQRGRPCKPWASPQAPSSVKCPTVEL